MRYGGEGFPGVPVFCRGACIPRARSVTAVTVKRTSDAPPLPRLPVSYAIDTETGVRCPARITATFQQTPASGKLGKKLLCLIFFSCYTLIK